MTLIIPVSRRNKVIISVVSFFILLFIFVSFMFKATITTETFKTKAEELNFEVIDVKDQYATNEDIEEAFSAKYIKKQEEQDEKKENDKQDDDENQLEFYIFKDIDSAIKMYNVYNSRFEDSNVLAKKEITAKRINYASYTLLARGHYMHICRVENTLLYARVKYDDREEYKKLIKELDY